jgi:hypothetical protein
MGALLPEAFAAFLRGKEVTLWMMSCGALVLNPESYTQLAAEVQRQVNYPGLSSRVKLKALIPFQAPYLTFDCIYRPSAPTQSHSRLHPCLCAASFG